MLAAWYEQNGAAADVMKVGDMPDPEPAAGEVRVRLSASAINPSDVKGRAGSRKIAWPRIVPNSDGAGVIDRVGAGVALDNVKPVVEVKSRRVGGATYQVPLEVSPKRQTALACRWLILYAKTRRGQPMRRALAMEVLDAYNNQGSAVKKRDDTHKMAQANKAFAHYKW